MSSKTLVQTFSPCYLVATFRAGKKSDTPRWRGLDAVEDVAWGERVRIQNDFEVATRQGRAQADPAISLLNRWAADSTCDPEGRHALFVEAQHLMHESAWFGVGNILRHNRIHNFPLVDGSPAIWGSLREWESWLEG